MLEQHFLSPDTADPKVFGPLRTGERVMWRGRCGVAEYAFDQAASMPRWTLPESTDVLVTDRRVIYSHTPRDGERVRSGELQWLWPQHIRVQPGARSDNRGAASTQIQLVCGGADGTFPALVFAGGDLATVDDAGRLDLDPNKTRMLSRALIGPEFRNHQGGPGQTVSIIGSLLVDRPSAVTAAPLSPPAVSAPSSSAPAPSAPAPSVPAASAPAPSVPAASAPLVDDHASFLDRAEGTRLISYRPGRAADAARAIMAARAEQESQQSEPEVASRAADLAARIADMVTASVPDQSPGANPAETPTTSAAEQPTADLSETKQPAEQPTADLSETKQPAEEPTGGSAVIIEFPLRMSKRPADKRIPEPRHSEPRYAEPRPIEPRQIEPRHIDPLDDDVPTTNLAARAESLRRTAARMAANSGRGRLNARRRPDREPGITSRGNRDR
jgi:hypothetical protein